jgi:hypothetical protein
MIRNAVTPLPCMPNSNPGELLAKFRADLKHFEESGDVEENASIATIREHLLRRITELEAAVRRTEKP